MANIDELLEQASEIRDANEEKENTALRVGTMLVDILQYIAGFIDRETLRQILQEYASLSGAGLVNWRQSRCVFLATMGTELDNIDGGQWEYTSHDGDIVFNPSSRTLRIVGETSSYFTASGVIYVNAHTGHLYKWDVSTQKMTELVDSSSPTVIDYRNAPAFDDIPIGATYYFLSQSSGYKIGEKVDAHNYCSFVIDPKKVYAFRDTRQTAVWNADTQTWTPISGRVINDLTTGGEGDALSAEQGKVLKMAIDDKGVSFEVKGDTLFIRTASSPMVNVLPSSVQFADTIFGNTKTATVHIYGRNLTNQVSVQVSGVGFNGSTILLPDIDGKVDADVTITFAPTANTGTEGDGGRNYEGSVTAVYNGAESASATLEGFGVRAIMPRITATIDKAALKGVLDTTADGAYTSEPATATLHVQASSINKVLTLAVDNAKFALSESQIEVEDAIRGKDITVTYLRQSAVTAEDDECTITITATHDNTSVQSTVAVSGATAAKKTSGTIATIDGLTYLQDTWAGMGSIIYAHSGAITGREEYTFPEYFFDAYGYKYIPKAFETLGGDNCSAKKVVIPSNVIGMLGNGRCISKEATEIKFSSINFVRLRTFNGCLALKKVDMVSFQFNYQGTQEAFKGCEKLETVILRTTSSTVPVCAGHNFDLSEGDVLIRDYDSGTGTYLNTTTTGTAYYYLDGNGVKRQKKLYVQDDKVGNYKGNAYWGLFEVHGISELSE